MQTLLTPYLNTSYVDIKRINIAVTFVDYENLNTSYVDIKLHGSLLQVVI